MNDNDESSWIDVASIDEIAPGKAKEVIVGPNVIAIFQVDDRYFALDGLCAHQGGPIAKGECSLTDQGKPCVTCPWHGWQYELETGIQTVNRQPLQRTFPVRKNGDRIEVSVD
ncbi:Rieske (2Fe-2S) protein [Stieleria sp. JC731]|uniref:Rieske (2Fe-2S) protein n=1 Tax=Pirellulaceae TaxID=2691357 RepID=UPI001E468A42|nr:Rieske (2Fe-2S) protein [Stieleria sp. JC731]MCC9602961.1 Rieske (2Fe-2S) protein [Stieleria sp. JC731]